MLKYVWIRNCSDSASRAGVSSGMPSLDAVEGLSLEIPVNAPNSPGLVLSGGEYASRLAGTAKSEGSL
jgi:hypothetical protein